MRCVVAFYGVAFSVQLLRSMVDGVTFSQNYTTKAVHTLGEK